MSIVAVHPYNTRMGGVSVAAYPGRFSSAWLNRTADYSGLTAADTALAGANGKTSNITLECFVNGTSIGAQTITNLLTDASRGIRTWDLGGLPPGGSD